MRISDSARKCVVYMGLCDPVDRKFEPYWTGFLVRGPKAKAVYLVTAKHCVKDNDPFYVRMNTPSGAETVLFENPNWVFHDDANVDVAIMEFAPPPTADYLVWHNAGLSEERLAVGDFGPGDLTYTVGLFHYHSGKAKNLPLVHTGHIAAFSEDEKIEVPDWDDASGKRHKLIDGYVVQCMTMQGSSGSPVFVRKPIGAADEKHTHDEHGATVQWKRVPPGAYGAIFLLGLWRGSWEFDPAKRNERLPTGYGSVVPAQKIQEVLELRFNSL